MKAKFITRNAISFEVESPEEAMLLEAFLEMEGKLRVWDNDTVYLAEEAGVEKVVILKSIRDDE